ELVESGPCRQPRQVAGGPWTKNGQVSRLGWVFTVVVREHQTHPAVRFVRTTHIRVDPHAPSRGVSKDHIRKSLERVEPSSVRVDLVCEREGEGGVDRPSGEGRPRQNVALQEEGVRIRE